MFIPIIVFMDAFGHLRNDGSLFLIVQYSTLVGHTKTLFSLSLF